MYHSLNFEITNPFQPDTKPQLTYQPKLLFIGYWMWSLYKKCVNLSNRKWKEHKLWNTTFNPATDKYKPQLWADSRSQISKMLYDLQIWVFICVVSIKQSTVLLVWTQWYKEPLMISAIKMFQRNFHIQRIYSGWLSLEDST